MKRRVITLLLISALLLGLLTGLSGAVPGEVNARWLPDGVEVAADLYADSTYSFHENDLIVVRQKNNGGDALYGLADRYGRLVLPTEYQAIEPFSEGLALVAKDNLAGYVDQKGKIVIPLRYKAAGNFSEGVAWVSWVKDGRTKVGFVDRNGKETALPYLEVSSLSDGLARVMELDKSGNQKFGFVLKNGKTIVKPRFDAAEPYCEGMALVMQKDVGGQEKYGFVDKSGKVAIPMEYDAAESFSGGLALVMKKNVGWGFVNKAGEVVVPLRYSGAGSFSEGFAPVVKRDAYGSKKYGFVNENGELAVPLQFDHASGFSDGLAVVMKLDEENNPKYGFVNKSGELVIPITYDSALLFSEGLALVMQLDAEGGQNACFIDKTGKEVLPLAYNGVRSFANGYARVISIGAGGSKSYGFIDKNGREVLSPDFGIVDLFPKSTVGYLSRSDGKYGIFELPKGVAIQEPPTDLELAIPATQTVEVDGVPIEFQMYAVIDKNGNPTNYVKLRDIAQILNGTAAQFNVGWNGSVSIETGTPYIANGSEMKTPFSGSRPYASLQNPTVVDGAVSNLTAILLTSDSGGGYTYYRLRTLGKTLGFNVGWSKERGVYVESDKPYVLVTSS